MEKKKPAGWSVYHDSSPDSLVPPRYRLSKDSAGITKKISIVDTYDWLLLHSGYICVLTDETIELRTIDTWTVEISQDRSGVEDDSLPDDATPAAQRIREIIYPRALSRRFILTQRSERNALRNRDGKIICYVDTQELRLFRGRSRKCVRMSFQALKGYIDETKKIASYVNGRLGPVKADPLSVLLEGRRDDPNTFRPHKSLALAVGLPLPDASAMLLMRLAEFMQECVSGIIKDIDTEFLHDFRVCVRKSRAFLSLLKGHLIKEKVTDHKTFLRLCGKQTTEIRDLDVYLLDFPLFYNALPPYLHKHLRVFENRVRERRTAAWQKLVKFIKSDEYRERIKSWMELLQTGNLFDDEADPASLGREFIAGRYGKISEMAGRITESTPDQDLHSLRIECKKLRYCVEFFLPIYTAGNRPQHFLCPNGVGICRVRAAQPAASVAKGTGRGALINRLIFSVVTLGSL